MRYLRQGYVDAFEPEEFPANAEAALRVMKGAFSTPFSVGRYDLERLPSGVQAPSVFVFDSRSVVDTIDFWNLTQFRARVVPVDVRWFGVFEDFVRKNIGDNFRPLPGNPHGTMACTTIEFGRSIDRSDCEALIHKHLANLPAHSFHIKLWYDHIWQSEWHHGGVQPRRATLSAKEEELDLAVSDDDRCATLKTLTPDFAERHSFGQNPARWVNVVRLRDFSQDASLATSYPTNTKHPDYPRLRLGEPTIVSRGGIVLFSQYFDDRVFLRLQDKRDAIIGWLKAKSIEAETSSAGRNAEQVLRSVGGLGASALLADEATLQLLDRMARTVQESKDGSVAMLPDRTASIQEWKKVIAKRSDPRSLSAVSLESFTKKNLLRIGMSIGCPACAQVNWYDLERLAYRVKCDRCLREFDFPQGKLHFNEKDWRLRVVGPFSLPGYALGAYSTLLTLRLLANGLGVNHEPFVFSTGLDLVLAGKKAEVDFVAWHNQGPAFGVDREPSVVFGETKSFGTEVFHDEDIERLKAIAHAFPGVYLVLAAMKRDLAVPEKKRIRRLAEWGRVLLRDGQPRASIIVLTGLELFSGWGGLRHAWKSQGGRHAAIVEHQSVRPDDLWTLAELTQRLYLDMPGYWEKVTKHRGRSP